MIATATDITTMQGLRNTVFYTWGSVVRLQGRSFEESEDNVDFLKTVAQFGLLRSREAWEKAFAFLLAEIYRQEDEPQFMVERIIHDSKQESWRHLLMLVVQSILSRPDDIEKMHVGLVELREDGWMLGEPDLEGLSLVAEFALSCNPEAQMRQLEKIILQRL